MSDALCGPSNALQSFQKHSTVDRTLQQDRLTTRQSPSQGFRSSPGPSAGLLDPEFEAFQAGQIPLQQPEPQRFNQAGFPALHTPPSFNTATSAAWASDFNKLSITGAPLGFQQTNYAHQQRLLGGVWQNEFAQQQNQSAGPSYSTHTSYNVPLERLSSIAQMPQNLQPLRMPPMQADQELLNRPQKMEQFDEEAFARAFDAATQSELALAQEQFTEAQSEILMNESAEGYITMDHYSIGQQRLGADLIHDPREGSEKSQTQDDPDALARTAGQLLDSVKDNQSEKFQNSQFLELMRQLRDREVTVEGDKIVGVQSQERDALEKSLYSIARQLSLLDFRRVEPLLASQSHSFPTHHSLKDQLVIGAFVRTLMHVSGRLENLLKSYPDLIRSSKPFGLHIGPEVFALADNPLLDTYPALKSLVLSFKSQFRELGIDPHMVRRASTSSATPNTTSENENDDENNPPAAEQDLRDWLEVWLATTPGRGYSCLICPRHLRQLLGPSLVEEGTLSRPTQEQVDRLVDILGVDVVQCMILIMNPGEVGKGFGQTVLVGENGVSFEDFEGVLEHFQEGEIWCQAERGGWVGEERRRISLGRAFPAPDGEWGADEQMKWLMRDADLLLSDLKVFWKQARGKREALGPRAINWAKENMDEGAYEEFAGSLEAMRLGMPKMI